MDTKELGNFGEGVACEYLVKKGYKIVGKNYRTKLGEIDIIVKKKGLFADETIHFVEVKTLNNQSSFFYPENHFDYRKKNKYKRLAEIWLSKNKYPENTPYQIDLLTISGSRIDFLENVVSEL